MENQGVGIIGTGWGTRVQVPAFRAAGLSIVALAGQHARKTQRIAAELDIPYATGDWQTLLKRSDVALVSIVTPPSLHCAMSIAALSSGKHVLCEKPAALDAVEAHKMVEAARAYPDQLALIDHELRLLPSLKEARRLVQEGAIGHIRHAEAHYINSSRANLQRIWNWWSDVAQGGGILGAICSHQVDTLRYVLNDEVKAVLGFRNTFITERPVDTPKTDDEPMRKVTSGDFAAFYARFARGGVASILASMVARVNESQSCTLYGDAGTLRFIDGKLLYAEPDDRFQDITPPHTIVVHDNLKTLYPDYAEATVYMGYALRAALCGDRAALATAATFQDGLRIQRVLDAVRQSNTYTWVEVESDE